MSASKMASSTTVAAVIATLEALLTERVQRDFHFGEGAKP
jgi:hypothetical protein